MPNSGNDLKCYKVIALYYTINFIQLIILSFNVINLINEFQINSIFYNHTVWNKWLYIYMMSKSHLSIQTVISQSIPSECVGNLLFQYQISVLYRQAQYDRHKGRLEYKISFLTFRQLINHLISKVYRIIQDLRIRRNASILQKLLFHIAFF